MASGPPLFPAYNGVDLRDVAVFFNLFKDATIPLNQHEQLPLPPPDSKQVVIFIDGIGSSSAGQYIRSIVDWLDQEGFATCIYSYCGIRSHFYEPRDTVRVKFGKLVRQLQQYVEYYSQAERLIFVCYSFGGLIASQWLYEKGPNIRRFRNFRGSCFIASPVRLRPDHVFYSKTYQRTADVRVTIDRILQSYTAIPAHVPSIASMIILRCERDRLLDKSAYTFEDLVLDEQPTEEVVIPHLSHDQIIRREELKPFLVESVRALFETRSPRLWDLRYEIFPD